MKMNKFLNMLSDHMSAVCRKELVVNRIAKADFLQKVRFDYLKLERG
jgi:hypothetical protein